jgi:hypothetical protein
LPAHRLIVATGYRVAGLALGVPAFLSFMCLTAFTFDLHQLAAPDRSPYLDIHTYGLVGLLTNGAQAFSQIVAFLAGLGAWVAAALAILSLSATLFSVVVYLTGGGVGRRATWARILASLLSLGLFLVAVGALLTFHRDAALIACPLIGAALYSLWVLGWKFA